MCAASEFCSGNLFERDSKLCEREREKDREKNSVQIICEISLLSLVRIFRNTRNTHSFRKRNLDTPLSSILPTKYHSISGFDPLDRAIVSHFHLSVYFTCVIFDDQYCACRISDRIQTDCMYIKLLIYYLSGFKKIAFTSICFGTACPQTHFYLDYYSAF